MTHENTMLAVFVLAALVSIISFRRLTRSPHRAAEKGDPPGTATLLVGNALALLSLVFLGLTIGEIHFRFVHDSTDSFGLTKTTRAWLERHYELNAQGFRDSVDYMRPELSGPGAPMGVAAGTVPERPSPSPREITFLGDSFLAGHGINDVEDRFANRIRRAHGDWNVVALSRLGADTRGETEMLEQWIAQGYSLGTVVLVYCLNDIQSVAPEAAAHDARIRAYQSIQPPIFMRHSFLLDRLFFDFRTAHDPAFAGYFDFLDRAYSGISWQAQSERLDELIRVVEDAGAELRVVTFPFLHALDADYPFREAHQTLDSFWKRRGIPHLDLTEVLARHPSEGLIVNRRDRHPNERANALAAEAIAPFLAQNIDGIGSASRTRAPRLAPRGDRIWPAVDAGPILAPGGAQEECRFPNGEVAPGACDHLGARDAWLFEHAGTYHLHYDAIGDRGWVVALATSEDFVEWTKRGPRLDFGDPGAEDSGAAAYGVPFFDEGRWHLFYLGTPNVSSPPERIPAFPYHTQKAVASSPLGPWRKETGFAPLRTVEGTWYSETTSPGAIVRLDDGSWLQVFSGAAQRGDSTYRTLGLARTDDLDGTWRIDPEPILPPTEQVENASLYFEEESDTWFLFTNRVHASGRYTDAIVVYWSDDLEHWNPANKAVVLDGRLSRWSKGVIGLPSVLPIGDRLALVYDGLPGRATAHVGRSLGLAWMPLPLVPPAAGSDPRDRRALPLRWEMNDRQEIAASQQLAIRVEGGRLEGRVLPPHNDPFLVLTDSRVSASEYDRLRFRANFGTAPGRTGSIYYFFEGGFESIGFPVVPGWHTYEIDVGNASEWAGQIERIRIDLPGDGGAPLVVQIDWVALGSGRPSRQ